MSTVLWHGDCLEWMAKIDSASVDAVITDPPYAEISRDYGRLSEVAWHELMNAVVLECRRILKPSGSAVFVLQANQEFVGRTRPWLWKFMAKWAEEWNQVQDLWWWNPTAPPTVHCHQSRGLTRPSTKACVWLGEPDCYRNQDEILWSESDANKAEDRSNRALKIMPSGLTMRYGRCSESADRRGGVTPFNLIPIANADSSGSAGAEGHGAGTPYDLCDWFVRYLSKRDDVILDMFAGSGTIPLAALANNRSVIAIEKEKTYFDIMTRRIERPHMARPRSKSVDPMPLFD